MPGLQDLWSEIHGKRGDQVAFLCVNFGDSREVIADYWQRGGFTMRPVREQEHEISEAFHVRGYPTTYVVGPDGTILYRSVNLSESRIRQAIASTAKED